MFVPQALASEIAIARIWMTDGTAIIWQLSLDIDGALRLIAVSSDITLLMDSDSITFNSNNKPLRVSIELRQNGANIDWAFLTLEAGQSTGTFFNGTLNDATLGTIHRVDISQDSLLTDVVIGHVAVNKNVLGIFSFGPQLAAYNGEKAGDRFTRLIGENNIYGHVLGGGKDTIPMGPQTPQTLDTLLKEIETTDGGILYEPRWFNGLVYRTRSSIYSQDALTGPILELDYSQAHLSTFEPIDDDQNTRNDFTANKTNGGSARQVLDDESSLSISSIGRYDTSVEVNVASNEQLPDLASWGLTLGTVDQARYPEIVIQTERSIFTSDAELTESARKLDIGDYVRITGIPSWLPPEDVNQLVQGLNEDLHNFNYGITIHTAPADPWNIALYEDPQSRYESKGSFLLAELTAGGTSLSVSTPEGALWGDSDGDFDIMIGGERMTVTAVTGTTSPQTFTVTRAVNGISKSHSVGDVVRLFRQVRYAF